jgi:hypothetical protein
VEKQWLQLRRDQLDWSKTSTDLDAAAYVGLESTKLHFMFCFTMNRFMLNGIENSSINNFPADYTRRYHRRLMLKSRGMPQEKYLNALFMDDPFGTMKQVNPSIKIVEPATPAQLINIVFSWHMGKLGVKASASQSRMNSVQETGDCSEITDSSQTSNPDKVKAGAVCQEYMAILDDPLDEDMANVEDAPQVQSLDPQEKDENLLFVPKPPYNSDNVNAHLTRLNRLMTKFGNFIWFKFTVTNFNSIRVPLLFLPLQLQNAINYDRDVLIQALLSSIHQLSRPLFLYNVIQRGCKPQCFY